MYHQRIVQAVPSTRSRLEGIEALRGVAAIAVVLCHAARHVDLAFGAPVLFRLLRPGHAGVDLFFVLSGFIILKVHGSDIGQPHRLPRYAYRRLLRVWPLYWLALAVTIAIRALGGNPMPEIGTVLWNAALLPTGDPILGIAWTLQYEALFYLLFGALLLDRRIGIAALAGWLVAVLLVAAGPVTSMFGVEFFFGMGAAVLVRRGAMRHARSVAAIGALAFVAAWMLESAELLDGYGTAARFAYGLPAAALVAGIAALPNAAVARPLTALGGASYSIYLFHLAGIGTAWQALSRVGLTMPPLAWLVVLAGSGVAAGMAVHRLVERPMLATFRR